MNALYAILHSLDRAASLFFRALIRMYQWVLSPIIHAVSGPHSGCRHEPSCSRYALECYRIHNVFRATGYSLRRILRCNPFFEGGYDPVPARKRRNARNAQH